MKAFWITSLVLAFCLGFLSGRTLNEVTSYKKGGETERRFIADQLKSCLVVGSRSAYVLDLGAEQFIFYPRRDQKFNLAYERKEK